MIIKILINFLNVIEYLIFINIILSWIPSLRHTDFYKLINSLVSPILTPIRKILYKSPLGGPGMMLDFSPLIAYLIINFLKQYLNVIF